LKARCSSLSMTSSKSAFCFAVLIFLSLLYPILFPSRTDQEDLRQVPWHRRQYPRGSFRHRDSFLFLLLHSDLHRLYQGRTIAAASPSPS
jgi:hypothetical protein